MQAPEDSDSENNDLQNLNLKKVKYVKPEPEVFQRKHARKLKNKKFENFAKQESEIFDEKFNPKKSKTVNQNLFKTVNKYDNNAERPYDESSSDDSKPVMKIDQNKALQKSFDTQQNKFDMKREKNISNRVFSQGQGAIEHRKKEKASKNKRLGIVEEVAEKPRTGPKQKQKLIFPEHSDDFGSNKFFLGTFKLNPKFRNRAFVQLQELNLDVLIDNTTQMNRAMDGDTVLIQLDPVE